MRISHRLRQLTIWLACFALLFNGVLPSMASTLSPVSGFMQICSAEGNKVLDIATGKFVKESPESDKQSTKSAHCANCLPHTDYYFPLPVRSSDIPDTALSEAFPALFYHSPQTLFTWASAQPRAPPALS